MKKAPRESLAVTMRVNAVFEKERDAYRRAVALHADDWSCWWRLAELEAKYRDGDRVREALSRAVALNPDLSRRADAVWREFVLATPAK